MYSNHINLYYHQPYIQEHYYPTTFDDRQLGSFFPQMGPPSGPPPGLPPGQGPGYGPPPGLPPRPPSGLPPGGLPEFQPPFSAPGQGPGVGPPTAPPPSFVPTQAQQQVEAFAVDPGGIRRCLFRYTYIWLRGFEQFWFFPIFVGRTSIAGYRWTGFRWVYSGMSLRQIQSFTCI